MPQLEDVSLQENIQFASFLARLSPAVNRAYQGLSASMKRRVEQLVRCTLQDVRILADRTVKYAFAVAAVEGALETQQVGLKHTAQARAEVLGERHGFEDGYSQPDEAQRRFRRSRQARQQIHASLKGVLDRWNHAEDLIKRERSHLPMRPNLDSPVDLFSDENLQVAKQPLIELIRAVGLGDGSPAGEDSTDKELTRTRGVYWIWREVIPDYPGKLKEMLDLAGCWKLTDSTSVEDFRHIVRKVCRNLEQPDIQLGSHWIQVLSADPIDRGDRSSGRRTRTTT